MSIKTQEYKEEILKDIEKIPAEKLPRFYIIIHTLIKEFSPKQKEETTLKGLWKGSQVDDSLFDEAKKSLFSYEK
ncbi:MAG TPA: hypothetical protein PLH42_05255 [bacterium]|nr:hypothetical protein [bacterium]HPO82283.1 hypothetical protein [bacterium]